MWPQGVGWAAAVSRAASCEPAGAGKSLWGAGALSKGWLITERASPSALQDLEPQQLLLFVQSFGIPVSSMSKLLQYLDQAVAHDPQTLEQNIMDKSKSQGPSTSNRDGLGRRALREGSPGRTSSLERSGEAGLPCPSTPPASVCALVFEDRRAAAVCSGRPGSLLRDPAA